jgi:hypothetical protein
MMILVTMDVVAKTKSPFVVLLVKLTGFWHQDADQSFYPFLETKEKEHRVAIWPV